MSTLSVERCVACRRDSPRVTEAETAELRHEVPGWQLLERDGIARLERVFHFPSFADALAFTNRVGALAEAEGHHPALLNRVGAGHGGYGPFSDRPPEVDVEPQGGRTAVAGR
jgi:4a-hydroxytetrahydrobiopterin dehydratase